jgi:V/A-type H+-transporting ATPase subunit K
MYWLVALMTLSVLGIVAIGFYFELRPMQPGDPVPGWLKGSVGGNVLLFLAAQVGLVLLGMQDVLAQEQAAAPRDISIGMGLALIGAALPTALATIGAAIAVGPVGSAALAVIAEKPEVFGRSLVYLGLAEGIAIYGLVVSILILGTLG